MLIINNKSTCVIVLKAMSLPNLRLFPGHNSVEEKDFAGYVDNNPAAKALVEENLGVVDSDGVTHEMRIEAEAAKEKNEMLNKSAKALKAAENKIDKSDKTIIRQLKQLDKQAEQIEKQSSMIVMLQEQFEELKAVIDDPELADETKDEKDKKAKK